LRGEGKREGEREAIERRPSVEEIISGTGMGMGDAEVLFKTCAAMKFVDDKDDDDDDDDAPPTFAKDQF